MRNCLTLVVAASVAVGCSVEDPDLPKLHPVTGTVTLDDTPLARAAISFNPTGSTLGSGSTAMTDDQGKYELTTLHQGAGAPVGEYQVVISKIVQPDGTEFAPDPNRDMMTTPQKELVPSKYSDPIQTTLSAVVAEGGSTIDFKLKSKP